MYEIDQNFPVISQSVEHFYVLKGNNSFNYEYFWNRLKKLVPVLKT